MPYDLDRLIKEEEWAEIAKIGKPIVPDLLEKFKDINWVLRIKIVGVLGEIGDSAVVPTLIEAFHDRKWGPDVHAAIAKALGKLGDARAIPLLLNAVTDNDYKDVRTTIILALGDIGDPTISPALIQIFKGQFGFSDRDVWARQSVMRALGKICERTNDRIALKGISDGLRDWWDSRVRSVAAEVLLELQQKPEIVQELEKLIGPDASVTVRAFIAVCRTEWEEAIKMGPVALKAFEAAIKGHDQELALEAIENLAKTEDLLFLSAAKNLLIDMMKPSPSINPIIRNASAQALAKLGDERGFDYLVSILLKKDVRLMHDARDRLWKLGYDLDWDPNELIEPRATKVTITFWDGISEYIVQRRRRRKLYIGKRRSLAGLPPELRLKEQLKLMERWTTLWLAGGPEE